MKKEKNLFVTKFSQKKLFVALLNVTNICNFMSDLRLMNVPLVCLIETQASSTTVLRDVSSHMKLLEIMTIFGNFKSSAAHYNKHNLNV